MACVSDRGQEDISFTATRISLGLIALVLFVWRLQTAAGWRVDEAWSGGSAAEATMSVTDHYTSNLAASKVD